MLFEELFGCLGEAACMTGCTKWLIPVATIGVGLFLILGAEEPLWGMVTIGGGLAVGALLVATHRPDARDL
jgi:hypothetical protein